jgi:hypothetical protein
MMGNCQSLSGIIHSTGLSGLTGSLTQERLGRWTLNAGTTSSLTWCSLLTDTELVTKSVTVLILMNGKGSPK